MLNGRAARFCVLNANCDDWGGEAMQTRLSARPDDAPDNGTARCNGARRPVGFGVVSFGVLVFGAVLGCLVVLGGCGHSGGLPEAEQAPSSDSGKPTAGIQTVSPVEMPSVAARSTGDPRGAPLTSTAVMTIAGRTKSPVFRVERARSDDERSRGLMFRRSLAEDGGMLFYMGRDHDWAFWMRNTWISLDLIFINSDWVVVGVVAAVPPLTEAMRRCGAQSRYVLELNANAAERHGILVGTRFALETEVAP